MNERQNRIVALSPENFREMDGVTFDLDRFSRHCSPQPTHAPQLASATPKAPLPVFALPPVHIGWYPVTISEFSYPIMADMSQVPFTQTMCSLGSYSTSFFTTSFLSSAITSWGSYAFRDGISGTVGGYGLDLI